MKIKPSPIVSSMSGRLNGGVMRTQGNSCILQASTNHRQNLTGKQSSALSFGERIRRDWGALSVNQKMAWNVFASPASTGFNEFYKRNYVLRYFISEKLLLPPVDVDLVGVLKINALFGYTQFGFQMSMQITSLRVGFEQLRRWVVYATGLLGNRKPQESDFKLMKVFPISTSFDSILAPWEAEFQVNPPLGRMYVQIFMITATTGQTTTPQIFPVDIVQF